MLSAYLRPRDHSHAGIQETNSNPASSLKMVVVKRNQQQQLQQHQEHFQERVAFLQNDRPSIPRGVHSSIITFEPNEGAHLHQMSVIPSLTRDPQVPPLLMAGMPH